MKKRVLLLVLVLFLLASVSLTFAAEDKVAKAYQCLEGKVIGKCSTLSPEEKAFSLLALGQCKQELIDSAKKIDGLPQCWPSSGCNIAVTSKALLALQVEGEDTSAIADWLLSQKMVPTGLDWFLQIETGEEASCNISFQGGSSQVIIGADKKIKSVSSGCFTKSSNGYWLQISPSCQDKEFTISCAKSFLTNLLYKERSSSSPLFVSAETHRAGANGGTSEAIESYCFEQNNVCNYEGSLWASLALDYAQYYSEIDPFIPYLISLAQNNSRYFPEVFLYHLTGDTNYKSTLLSKKTSSRNTVYWKVDGGNNKFYDTALALYAFPNENFTEIANAKNWLLTQQDAAGCFGDSTNVATRLRDTAFILHSAWQDYGCKLDGECDTGKICENRVCVEGCRKDDACVTGKICDNSTNTCIAGCREDSVCGAGKICNNSTNTCITGCRTDETCGAGKICDSSTNTCVDGCRDTSDCSEGYICLDQTKKCIKAPDCTTANEATTCGVGNICVDGKCAGGCRNDTGCDSGFICLASNKTCVEGCRTDNQCPSGQICNANLTCANGCRTNQQCSTADPSKPICAPAPINLCFQCLNNTQCNNATEKCVNNECIPKQYECVGDSHCTNSSLPVCIDNKCVRCRYDSDCGNSTNPRLECSINNTCIIKPECRYDSECNVTTQICNNVTNKCVPKPACLIDRDCNPGKKCENQLCVQGCRDDNNCPSGQVCLNSTCGTGCRVDGDCPDNKPFCSSNNICIECKVAGNCEPGYTCSNNQCTSLPQDQCETSYDCPGDEICNDNGICVAPETSKPKCEEDKGYFCRGGTECNNDGGEDLSDLYACNVPDRCCSIGQVLESCSALSGVVCTSDKVCEGGTRIYDYSDARTGEFCCTGGECKDSTGELSQCETNGGACRATCLDTETVSYDSCTLSSDTCCIASNGGGNGGGGTTTTTSYLWLWIVLILIALAILGFVFRDKLRVLLMRIKGNKGPKGPPGFPGMPPPTSSLPMRRPMPRMIMPPGQPRPMMRGLPQQNPPMARPQPPVKAPEPVKHSEPAKTEAKENKKPASKQKPKSELDDVLKKLKDMGK